MKYIFTSVVAHQGTVHDYLQPYTYSDASEVSWDGASAFTLPTFNRVLYSLNIVDMYKK